MALDTRAYQALAAYPYFTYGSLMDQEVFRCVAEWPSQPTGLAWVEDRHRTRLANQSYPIVGEEVGSRVFGLLLSPLPPEALLRLHYYETADYNLNLREVCTLEGPLQALVFEPSGRAAAGSQGWRLSDWRQTSKAMVMWVQAQINQRLEQLDMAQADALFDQLEAQWQAGHVNASSELDPLGHKPANRLA